MDTDLFTDFARVRCHYGCGVQALTEAQYDYQMDRPNRTWCCPRCGDDASWDDQYWDDSCEARYGGIEDEA